MKLLQKREEGEKITDEEIEAFIDLGKDSWALEEEECENLKNMLDFGEKTCEEIMTPRIKIDALPANITVDEAIEKVLSFSHSRILVYTTDIDHIERVVTLKELYQTQRRGNGKKKLSELSLAPILKVSQYDLTEKLRQNSSLVSLKKNVDRHTRDEIAKLNLREIPMDKKSIRTYICLKIFL